MRLRLRRCQVRIHQSSKVGAPSKAGLAWSTQLSIGTDHFWRNEKLPLCTQSFSFYVLRLTLSIEPERLRGLGPKFGGLDPKKHRLRVILRVILLPLLLLLLLN